MSFGRNHPSCKVTMFDDGRSYLSGSYDYSCPKFAAINDDPRLRNYNIPYEFAAESRHQYSNNFVNPNPFAAPSLKRRRVSSSSWETCGSSYQNYSAKDCVAPSLPVVSGLETERANANTFATTSGKRDRSKLEEEEVVFMSRDEIEGRSPSRKDGIDALQEKQLRYSYCAFIQNLGLRLDLPQSTVGTAMVLCHRFFVRRSHACHDRFLIATASLFLAAKSEETARPLNNVLRASCEILHKQDLSFLSYMLPAGWFEQYRERVLDAEHLILTTLNFELNVKHPYAPLTSVLGKLGLAQSDMVKLALNLVNEGFVGAKTFLEMAKFGFVLMSSFFLTQASDIQMMLFGLINLVHYKVAGTSR
uniref:Cyclin-like domain-containing protein n=1 Tax=Kalanchoe fedtschenkoi TaxID=63787 RepID=A0A7N0V9D8_KALFE